ncbi:hypothetical protein VNO78_15334 [Psophocarpus tetragonolobus]|uniref:Uncharacterized protein n=1 Tax=Psophocarpus tetragonolobus TaxID=3891 RepID=A0AAN9SGB2_PSOTE
MGITHFNALTSPNQNSLISQQKIQEKENHTLFSFRLPLTKSLPLIKSTSPTAVDLYKFSLQILTQFIFGSLYDTLRNSGFFLSDFVSLGSNRNPISRIDRSQTGLRIQRPSRKP